MTKKALAGLGLVGTVLVLGTLALTLSVLGPLPLTLNTADPQKTEAALKAQLHEIQTPPQSHFLAQRRTVKETHGALSNEYRTDLSFEQLKKFYDAELSRQGWEFKKESEILWDRQNRGGKHLFYCKGEFTADLEYAGKMESEFGWTYSLSLTWGLSDDPCR